MGIVQLLEPAVVTAAMHCPWNVKGQLMRRLVEATLDEQVTLLDGIKIHHGDAWVAVLPDAERPSVHLWAERRGPEGPDLLERYRTLVDALIAEALPAAGLDLADAVDEEDA